MSRMTFINLPVKDVERSRAFFSALGFGFNEQFSDAETACLVISESSVALLHVEPKFQGFVGGVADPGQGREVLVGLSAANRAEVDTLVERAIGSGGESLGDAVEDGPMYMRAFRDPDGHQWSLVHLDMG